MQTTHWRRQMWKVVLLTIIVLLGTSAASVSAGEKDYQACVKEKIAALKTVTRGNAASKLRLNFSINFLAAKVVGGGAKWKAMNAAEQAPILALFSDHKIIGGLYDNLSVYRNVEGVSFPGSQTNSPQIIANVTARGARHRLTFQFAKGSCTLLNLCTGGKCVSDLFRINRPSGKPNKQNVGS
jgi:hypothetical protein